MRSRKIVTACVALVLVLVTLCGCGRVAIDAVVVEGDSLPGVMAEPLGYSYSEEEKKEIAAGGILYDFENKPVGTVFEGEDGEVSHSDGKLIYRPKFTKYKVVNSLCGKALMFERGAESAEAKADPFIDFEFDGSIESGVDFVVEMDVMPTECNMTVQLMRLIYRPTSGVVFCAYMTYKDGELKLNDNRIATLSASELTKIACVFHQSRNAVDIYINGYMVTYGVPYSGTDVKNEKPSQIRLIQASEGTGSFTVDNVAVYKGGVPFYVSRVTDNDIELLREYRFEQADGAYTGEQGMTVSAGNSSIYIKKTPDGRKTLRYGGVSGSGNGYLQVSAAGKGSMWNYSMAVYATSEETELSLVALIGSSLTPFLTLSGSVLTDELQGQAVCDLGIGRWNTLDLFFDEIALTYDLMINGYTYAADCPISSALLSGLVGLRTGIVGADRDFSVYLDNIRLYNATGGVGYRGAYPGGIET
ncbi:MAG: hypothetical protein IKB34_01250, partial [Clostridia bacterium]|nr:hypothetical protein [Clostridia bacterium]